ncbi:MAG: CBS domain-containing protein [Nitrososphaerales archaeon]
MPERASDLWWLFTRQTVSVSIEEKIIHAALLMHDRNFRHLPVVSEVSKLIGIISAQDIIDALNLSLQAHSSAEEIRESLSISIEKILTLNAIAVEPGDGLAQMINKLVHHNIGALPVVNERGVVQGIITLRDLVALIGMNSDPLGVRVSEIMNTKITTIQSEETFAQAVRLMSEKRVRRLPILSKKNELLGVITNKDILRHLLEATGVGRVRSPHELNARIGDLMTKDVITIDQDDDLRVAASRMMIFGVGGLLINDTEHLALLTERDLIRNLSSKKSIDFLLNAMQYESEQRVPKSN